MNKVEALRAMDLGSRVAEEEAAKLSRYFVETEEWRVVLSGEVDIIYGAKGSGKSAIYSLLGSNRERLAERNVMLLHGDTFIGTPVFSSLNDGEFTEEDLIPLWKLYFCVLLAQSFRERELDGDNAALVETRIEDAGLIPTTWSLRRAFNKTKEWVLRWINVKAVEGGVSLDPATGLPTGIKGKITPAEPSSTQGDLGVASVDDVLAAANNALHDHDLSAWIALDRLDAAFLSSADLERRALRALFRAYRDIAGLDRIDVKIFLRDDIWRRVCEGGFREASHITRTVTLGWSGSTLRNLIVRRILNSEEFLEAYEMTTAERDEILADSSRQSAFFNQVFPEQVDIGEKKPTTLDWILSRTCDSLGGSVPREIIHLLSVARRRELKRNEIGEEPPSDLVLVSRQAIKNSLPEVSKVRFQQTLLAEYPQFKGDLMALEGEKTEQTLESLMEIWGYESEKAESIAGGLSDAGFFEYKKDKGTYWVPFLYRDALSMVQGKAQ